MNYLLGIDDTDVLGQRPGTGRLARELGAYLREQRLATLGGVIRHQLLVDSRIPYTSHNSPACLMLRLDADGDARLRRVFDVAVAYVRSRCAVGSDPGLCLAPQAAVGPSIIAFGSRAGCEVVTKEMALELAKEQGVWLAELGGTGDGVIGALAAVGLTAGGNSGRFLELTGELRELGERVAADELRRRGITLLSVSRNAEVVPHEALIDTGDWVRPRLIAGTPVLLVQPTPDGWQCFDRKQRKDDGEHTNEA